MRGWGGFVMQITLDLVRQRLAHRVPWRLSERAPSLEAAVALLLAPGASGQLELLLIKRAEQPGDRWSGQMALPGGRRERSDEDLLVTAMRETWEEVGVALRSGWLVGELDDLHPRTPTLPPVLVRPYVFGLADRPAITLSPEAASHVWVSLEELASGTTRTEIAIPGRDALLPAYRVGSDVLWGMTERIVTPFIDLLR
jgi:8-oxo-dGTP pyrophosphatase MutT (NUDIX family)